jgi:anhydro-N-acetylmuramic acid kinase
MTQDHTNAHSFYIGLMSGTSMDGVDGVVARFSPRCDTVAFAHQAFPASLRAQFMALQQPGDNEIEREALAAHELASQYAACIEKLLQQSGLAAQQIRAVGAHGQTIRHRPEQAYTRQSQNRALM